MEEAFFVGASNTSMWVYVQLVTSMTVTWSGDACREVIGGILVKLSKTAVSLCGDSTALCFCIRGGC